MTDEIPMWKRLGWQRPGQYARTYNVWNAMRQRCLNPKSAGYKDYGGRGITVCAHWGRFDEFFQDMGPKPEGMTLDRENNDGNYDPGNCRWADAKTQRHNQRARTMMTLDGRKMRSDEASKLYGMTPLEICMKRSRAQVKKKQQEQARERRKRKAARKEAFRQYVTGMKEERKLARSAIGLSENFKK